MVNKDCFIVIGVDPTDYSLFDVKSDPNRKNTQNIVDFLKDKKFAGGIRPIVCVESVNIGNIVLDVIVIKNSFDTPFYLTEDYQGVFKSNIYTRVMDTNTPKTSCADINHVEYLWKKRFKLLESPLEKIHHYINKPHDWKDSPKEWEDVVFYKYAPEYRIVSEKDETRDGYEYYLFSQVDSTPRWYNVYLYYHQTILETFTEICMDGGRWRGIAPERSALYEGGKFTSKCISYYGYYIEGTLRYSLHVFLDGENDYPFSYQKYMQVVLVYKSELEKEQFEQYVINHLNEFKTNLEKQWCPDIPDIANCNTSKYKEEYKAALTLKDMLRDFRNGK